MTLSKRKKRICIILGIILLFAAFFTAYRLIFTQDANLKIQIQNESNSSLTELSIYCNETKLNTTHVLEAGKSVDLQINLPADFTEGNLTLYYEEKGAQKDIIICGYLEHGCHEKIKLVYTSGNEFQIN